MRGLTAAALTLAVLVANVNANALDSTTLLQAKGYEHQRVDTESKVRTRHASTLTNFGDAQYLTNLMVGGQKLKGIFDTGSFDLVVFPRMCQTCGIAAKFDPEQSSTFNQGILTSSQAYGSGDTSSIEAYDVIRVAPVGEVNQSFWSVEFASMPLLYNAAFNAIIGVGPPETAATDAWKVAVDDVKKVIQRLEKGQTLSENRIKMISESVQVATQVAINRALIDNLGVDDYSLCIGSFPGSDGYFIWNDDYKYSFGDTFSTMPVVGKHTWSVRLSNAELQGPGDSTINMGCETGCSALLDSGTSLLGLPSNIFKHLDGMISKLNPNCSNVDELPNLVFHLGDKRITLPPSSYVAEATGSVPNHLRGLLKIRSSAKSNSLDSDVSTEFSEAHPRCQLFIMELKSASQYGSTWILGLPFFRKYYTTFGIGKSKEDRTVSIAQHDGHCNPGEPGSMNAKLWSDMHAIRRIEMSRLYVPPRVQHAALDDYVQL